MTFVSPDLRARLEAMADDPRPAYAAAGRAAVRALADGSLAGLVRDGERARMAGWYLPPCRGGAYVLVKPRGAPEREDDLPAVIVTADAIPGPPVLVHEISHFRNRWVVDRLTRGTVLSRLRGRAGHARASFLNELAARHTAFLAEENRGPHTTLPVPGALFACAVKIASYPEVFHDDGSFAAAGARGEDALRDSVGGMLGDLAGFVFFERGSELEAAHHAYLDAEAKLATAGRHAPRVQAEGTI